MKIFFSAKQNSFFRDDFHGTRTVLVNDPEWVRPTIEVLDPEWTAPLIKVSDPSWVRPLIEVPNPEWKEDNSDTPKTVLVLDEAAVAPVIDVADPEAKQPTVQVPDTSVVPPQVEVPNPACLLPPEKELVEMTMDEFMEIQNLIATTPLSVVSSDKNGRPIVVPYPGQTAEQILAGARQKRDWLLNYATLRINPLQDDVDNGESTPDSEALLKLWKQYRSAVSKTQDKPGWPVDLQWPNPPVPLEIA